MFGLVSDYFSDLFVALFNPFFVSTSIFSGATSPCRLAAHIFWEHFLVKYGSRSGYHDFQT